MKQGIFDIISNTKIADGVMKMVLLGDTSAITAPGQFVNIKLDGFYLRRPISVCDRCGDALTLIYKIVGGGTEAMSLPSKITCPASGVSKPPMMRSIVVFPQPDGPSSVTNSRRRMYISTL